MFQATDAVKSRVSGYPVTWNIMFQAIDVVKYQCQDSLLQEILCVRLLMLLIASL